MAKKRITSRLNQEQDKQWFGSFLEIKEWLEAGAYLRIIVTENQKSTYWICDNEEAYYVKEGMFSMVVRNLDLDVTKEYHTSRQHSFYMRLSK